jgi:hypothetical protein
MPMPCFIASTYSASRSAACSPTIVTPNIRSARYGEYLDET